MAFRALYTPRALFNRAQLYERAAIARWVFPPPRSASSFSFFFPFLFFGGEGGGRLPSRLVLGMVLEDFYFEVL